MHIISSTPHQTPLPSSHVLSNISPHLHHQKATIKLPTNIHMNPGLTFFSVTCLSLQFIFRQGSQFG